MPTWPRSHPPTTNAYPLRFYASPFKLIALLALILAICACSALVVFLPTASATARPPAGVALAWLFLLACGYGAIAYLILITLLVILRRLLLEIDRTGWTYRNPFTFGERFIPWDNIISISIRTVQHYRAPSECFIIATPRRPEALPHATRKVAIRRLLATYIGPELAASCRYLFLWGSQARAEELLQRIEIGCAADIHAHHVSVHRSRTKRTAIARRGAP